MSEVTRSPQHSWKPVAGGVLSIVAGSFNTSASLVLLAIGGTLSGILAAIGSPTFLRFVILPVFGSAAMRPCLPWE